MEASAIDGQKIEGLRPKPSRDSKPYWDGLKDGRILLQQCVDCGNFRHYPRPVCPDCYSMAVNWVEAQGSGTVHTWTVCHHAFHPAYKKDLPTVYVTVDLPEGVRLCGRLRNDDGEDLAIGRAVRLAVEIVDADLALPIVEVA